MTSRGLGAALIIALGVHVAVMSAVDIVSYSGPGRTKPYTRIDFLGPILGKTSFDMMVAHHASVSRAATEALRSSGGEEYLAVTAEGRILPPHEPGRADEDALDASVSAALAGWEATPGEKSRPGSKADVSTNRQDGPDIAPRKVVHRPDAPFFIKGQYGEKDLFRVKVKVLVGADGSVIRTEPVTTTGYPQLDMSAAKSVKGWIYEPSKPPSRAEEWIEEEVVLKSGE